jgi:hypothetical protein
MNHSGNTGRFVRAVLAGALAGSLSMPIGAMPIWTNAGTGDWFVAGNWDTGFVPTPADDVQVNNGGTAVADSSSAAYPGPGTLSETNAFDVGVRTNTLAPAIGTVQMLGVNLAVGDALSIGVVNSGFGIGPFTSATGNLETSAGANADGNVDVVTDARVGVFVAAPGAGTATGTANVAGDFSGSGTGQVLVGDVSGQGNANGTLGVSGNLGGFTGVTVATANLLSTGNATGDLTVDGMLSVSGPAANLTVGLTGSQGNATGSAQVGGAVTGVNFVGIGLGGTDTGPTSMAQGTLDVLSGGVHAGFDASSFEVGTTNGDGDVTGVANVSGGVSGYGFYEIGIARANSLGDATGMLAVKDGPVTGSRMRVGISEGGGTATGTVELERSLVALDEALILGSGATLDFHLSGLSRGVEYAAIDAVMATLDGTANIYFDFVPMLGIHVFDLIVTQALDGILNDFDPGAFNIFGLDPLFNVVHGIVVDNVLGNDVEIYRLEISSSIANVPEPSVVTLLAFSLLILFATRRRENHRFGFG